MNLNQSIFVCNEPKGARVPGGHWWWLLPFLVTAAVWGQAVGTGTVKGGWTTQFHDSENRLRSVLSGDGATPIDGFFVIKLSGLKIKMFNTNGVVELTAAAPECIYDVKRKVAYSAGPLAAATENQQLALSGVGFEFSQEKSRLTVSNQVHTTIRRQTNAPGQVLEKPIEVFADRLDIDTATNRAVYRGNVRADDPQMELTSGLLTVRLGAGESGFESIEAEESVVVKGKADGSRTTADRAIYNRAKERVELFGNPIWEQGGRRAKAEVITFDRLDRGLEAKGKVELRIPRDALGTGGFFITAGALTNAPGNKTNAVAMSTNTASASPQLIDVFADQLQSRSNVTIARGSVRIVDGTNQLTGGVLTLTAPTRTSAEATVLVEENVAVTQGIRSVTADRMHYTKSTETVVFTGSPKWRLEQTEGSADTLTLQPRTSAIEATGHTLVKLLRTGGAGSFLPVLPLKPGVTNRSATPVEVSAEKFSIKERRALFTGQVQASETGTNGADSRLRCAELEIRFAEKANRAEWAVARGGVVLEQGRVGVTNGPGAYQRFQAQTVTARMDATNSAIKDLVAEKDVMVWVADAFAAGERMNYDVANDALQLEGDPFFINDKLMIYDAKALTVDRKTGLYTLQKPYTITLFMKPGATPAPALFPGGIFK